MLSAGTAHVHVFCDPAVVTALCSLFFPHHFSSGLRNLSSAVDLVFPDSYAWKELRVLFFLHCGGIWGEEYLPAVTSEFASRTVTRIRVNLQRKCTERRRWEVISIKVLSLLLSDSPVLISRSA